VVRGDRLRVGGGRGVEPGLTTSTERIRPGFGRNRLLQALVAWYAVFWIARAIAPKDRSDWLLENLLVFLTVPALVATYRRFPLSNLSYLFITAFLTLHAIGAHYTYEHVPAGYWVKAWLNLSRNHFDRLVHFAFGLLLAYPVREVFLRIAQVRGFWAYYLPLDVTLAFSALFEIIESWIARITSPELGNAYLGMQGDVWDAQKDMTAALIGGVLCMSATAIMRRYFHKGQRVRSPLS
jgi:putative membrane protein